MVERQLRRRGIGDERVLEAMGEVPRERFVPERHRRRAYADSALPIGESQTISQPWIVAAICQALELRGFERVLEVGTGSGYSTAVLARLAGEVISIERVDEPRRRRPASCSTAWGSRTSRCSSATGARASPERAPFDSIAVHATAPAPPRRPRSSSWPSAGAW